jgi:hypothetical protein
MGAYLIALVCVELTDGFRGHILEKAVATAVRQND